MAFVLDEKLTTKWYDTLTVIPDDGDNVWFIVGDKIFVGVYCAETKRFYKADKSYIDLCEVRQWSPMNGEKQICKQPDNEQVVAANVRGVKGYVTGIFSKDLGQQKFGEKGPGLLLDEDYNIAELGVKSPLSWEDVFDWYELPLEPMLLLPVVSIGLIPLTISELTKCELSEPEEKEQPKEEISGPKPTSAIVASKNRNLMEKNNEETPMSDKLQETRLSYELTESFQPWGPAVDIWRYIINNDKFDELDSLMEDWYPEGIGETEFNDILAYDYEPVLEALGLRDPYAEDDEDEDEEEEEEDKEEEPVATEEYKGYEIYTWADGMYSICKNGGWLSFADGVEDAKKLIDEGKVGLKRESNEKINESIRGNTKQFVQNVEDYINSFGEDKWESIKVNIQYLQKSSKYGFLNQAIRTYVEGGSLDAYYDEVRKVLNKLYENTPEEAKKWEKYPNDKLWERYINIMIMYLPKAYKKHTGESLDIHDYSLTESEENQTEAKKTLVESVSPATVIKNGVLEFVDAYADQYSHDWSDDSKIKLAIKITDYINDHYENPKKLLRDPDYLDMVIRIIIDAVGYDLEDLYVDDLYIDDFDESLEKLATLYGNFRCNLKESLHKIVYSDNVVGYAEPGDDILLFYKHKNLGHINFETKQVYLRQGAPEEAKELFPGYIEKPFKFGESINLKHKRLKNIKESKLHEDYGWEVKSGYEWDLFEELKESLGVSELLLALCKAMGDYELGQNLAFICRNYDYNNPYLEGYEEDKELEESKLHEDYGWEVKSGCEWDLLNDMVSQFGEEEILKELAYAMGTFELGENLAYICRNYDYESSYLENGDEELDESVNKDNKLEESGRLSSTIKSWYVKKYPTDELGPYIDSYITFKDLSRCLQAGCNFYDLIGVGDSLIRERVFNELANRLKVDYSWVYDLWLRGKSNIKEIKIKESKSDGWPSEVAEIFSDVFYDVERFKYEIDRCIRGSFTSVTDIEGLCEVAKKIGNEWINVAENELPYVNDPDIKEDEDSEELEESKENDFSYLPENLAKQVSDYLNAIKL